VVGANARVAVTVPAEAVPGVTVAVGLDGTGDGIVAAISVILAWAVWAAAVKTACGSSVGVASACPSGLQAERLIEANSKTIHRVFFKRTISPPEDISPQVYPFSRKQAIWGLRGAWGEFLIEDTWNPLTELGNPPIDRLAFYI